MKAPFRKKDEFAAPEELKTAQLIAFCMEMSLYLRAGNPVPECFYIFLKQEAPFLPKSAIVELYSETEMGAPLFEAMSLVGIFPAYAVSMVEAGEKTGHLEEVFQKLGEYYDSEDRIKSELRSAVLYPAILLAITVLVVFVVMPQVLPIYNDAFAALGGSVPGFTFVLIQMAEFLGNAKYYIMALVALFCVFLAVLWFFEPLRQMSAQRLKTRFYRSKTGKKLNSAFFASLLSLGISGGLDLDETMKMIERGFANRFGEDTVSSCRRDMADGMKFSQAVEKAGLLSPVDASILETGVATGSADFVMEQITRRTENAALDALSKTIGKIEPTIVLVMALVVGIVLIAVMFPLLGVMSAIG